MRLEEIDTPAVVIDVEILERNLSRMAAYCQAQGIHLRPHVKTHKIPEIARMQIARGAVGVTVAKVGEAAVMVEAGIEDVLVAYPIVVEAKAEVLTRLAGQARITISVDSNEAVHCLSSAASRRGVKLGILVEADLGFHRCGVATPEAAVSLAQQVISSPNLDFRGLMFYPGHLLLPREEQSRLLPGIVEQLEAFGQALSKADIPVGLVSGGSTPTAYRSHEFRGVTEIRPGMYALNDRNMLTIGACQLRDCALSVIVTVVSTAVSGRVIVDGGSKTFSSDSLLAGDRRGYGLVLEDPAAEFLSMSEEHGHLGISASSRRYCLGERLAIIPNHVCATINMHDRLYGVRNGRVECTWQVAARGRVQ